MVPLIKQIQSNNSNRNSWNALRRVFLAVY